MNGKLYHGTNTTNLPGILENGIAPRGARRSNWTCKSKPQYVYLTNTYGWTFALVAAGNSCAKPCVIEIDAEKLDEQFLYPDEDYIAQVLMNGKRRGERLNDPALRRCRTLKGMNAHIDLEVHQEFWCQSLQHLGVCAYKGMVPIEAITRYAICDTSINGSLAIRALDASVSVQAFMICGESHANLLRHTFDRTGIEDGLIASCAWSGQIKRPEAERRAKIEQGIEESVTVETVR